ncbi:zinc finger, CCHC-type containing protein [Tanacetum coccineum]
MLAIITRCLPFEFTISSRSTALMVERQMAAAAQNTNNLTIRRSNEVACLMLGSMSPDLQRALQKYEAYELSRSENYEVGQPVSSYLLKMKSYLDILERLGYAMPNELGGKIQKDKKKPRGAKGKDKGKTKLAYAPKPKISPPPKRDNPAKDSVCHHCHEVGHQRRNYPFYHAELKKRKNASITSISVIFTIELYALPNKTCVYDTGCGTHICNTSQGLKGSRKLKHRALSLYVGNGMCATVEAIGSFDLVLPRDLNEPPNYKAALSDPASDKWLEAMNTEMQSMKDNQVWILMDVKTAFLKGNLCEDEYMVKPEGFVDPKHPNKVCKLQHSMYGLKQTSRSWNKRFDEEIKKISFTQNLNEPCVYLKASGSNVAFLVLSKRFIALSQSAYLEKIIKKFKMENSKKGYTLMMEKPDYRKSQVAKTPTEKLSNIAKLKQSMEVVRMRKFIELDLEVSCHRIKGLWRSYVTMSLHISYQPVSWDP